MLHFSVCVIRNANWNGFPPSPEQIVLKLIFDKYACRNEEVKAINFSLKQHSDKRKLTLTGMDLSCAWPHNLLKKCRLWIVQIVFKDTAMEEIFWHGRAIRRCEKQASVNRPIDLPALWFETQFSIIRSHEMSKRVAFKVHRDVANRYEVQIKVRVVERSSSRDSILVFCKSY